mmetsp:Transcript_5334/g.11240  ORF Transcript_5334/g.11240 Transcript_5334/m.11240 type:complete len:225 (+) Transcript_5334:89-763(+)
MRMEKLGIAPSWATLTLHLGFNRSNDGDLDFSASNHYVFPSLHHDKNLASFSGKFTRQIPCCYVTCPSAKDASWPSRWPNRTVLTIQCPVRYEWFAEWQSTKNRSTCLEYVQFTEFWTDRLLNVVEKLYPGAKLKVHTKSLKTPLDDNKRFGVTRGESGGVEETVEKFFKYPTEFSPGTDVTGLYMTGKDLAVGAGVANGLWGGVATVFALSKGRLREYALSCV